MLKKLSVRIDGELVTAIGGQSILQVARASGKNIPTLCHLEGLTDAGACRLCMVEVAGVGRLLPACTTPVQDGMSVTTNSPKLANYRRVVLELLLVERNHVCSVCVSNGHCELQTMAQQLGVTSVRFPYNYPKLPVDVSHRAIRAGSQSLHPVYAMRSRVRRSGRRARLGSDRARHPLTAGQRSEPAVGIRAELHELRQVRAGVSHRRAGGEGAGGGGDGEADQRSATARRAPGSGGMTGRRLAAVSVSLGWARCGCDVASRRAERGVEV